MGRPDSLSDPRRHCHPAGCPVLAASARASLSARSGRCRQYDSTARRWVAGIRGCRSACDRTHAGKDAESRFSRRASALWFFSSRQVDIPKQPSRVHAIGAIAAMPAKGNWGRGGLEVRVKPGSRNGRVRRSEVDPVFGSKSHKFRGIFGALESIVAGSCQLGGGYEVALLGRNAPCLVRRSGSTCKLAKGPRSDQSTNCP